MRLFKPNLRWMFYISLGFYILLFIYNRFIADTQWWLDAALAIGLLIIAYSLNRWLRMGRTGFLLFNLALLLHNLGAFGAYELGFWIFGYDNLVHFTATAVGGYIFFNFIARKMHVKEDKRLSTNTVDEHLVIMIFLVMASVAFMGTVIELLEFGGWYFLEEGDGLFFAGEGDTDGVKGVVGAYIDTMTDIIVNTLGSIFGTLCYYFFVYRKKPWLKYY